jgi:hypothetical protein
MSNKNFLWKNKISDFYAHKTDAPTYYLCVGNM